MVEDACYYSPGRVRYWLEHWSDLQELAIPTVGAIRYDRLAATPDGMRPFGGMHYTEIVVDLERAWALMGHRWSLEWQVVEWHMRGECLASIAGHLRVGMNDADGAMGQACEAMARRLGWSG